MKAFSTFFLCAAFALPAFAESRSTADPTGTSDIGYDGAQRLNYVPGVYSDKREREDPDFTRDPDRDDLISLIKHVADLIADRSLPQDSLPGVDLFMDNLQEEMKHGSDIPRYKILMNADGARGVMAAGYDELRYGLVPMIVAHEKLKRVENDLRPIVRKNTEEDAPAIEAAAETLDPAAQAIQPDPPSAQGAPADASAVRKIQDQSRDLKPLKPPIEEAKEKLKEAKKRIAAAEAMVPGLRQYAMKAGQLEDTSQDSLSQSRTSGGSRFVGRQGLSKKVIENAEKWMKKAVDRAKEVHKELEEMTRPKEGLPKALGAAEKASAEAMKAKDALEAGEREINGSREKVQGPIRSAWERAQEETEKQEQVAKAAEEKSKAGKSAEQGKKASKKAKKAAEESKKASKKTKDKLARLRKKFGNPDDADQLNDLPPMSIRVAKPKAVAPTGGRYRTRRNVRSQKLTYPQDLSRNVSDVICDNYGERDCRAPGGSSIGRTAADRSGMTGAIAGGVSAAAPPARSPAVSVRQGLPGAGPERSVSAKSIAEAAYGSWHRAWETGKQTLAGGARGTPPGAAGKLAVPEKLAAIKPAIVIAKTAEAQLDRDPLLSLRMADESIGAASENPYAYFVRAKALVQLKRYEEALAAVETAIAQDGGRSALLYHTKAEILNRMGRYGEAVAAAETAIRLEEENAHGYAQASWGFAGMREYASSLEMMERASLYDGNYRPLFEAMRALRDRNKMLALFEGERKAAEVSKGARSMLFKFVREGRESYFLAFAVAVCLVGVGAAGIVFDLSRNRLRRWFERWRL
jgi:tetratricopeptide (TPR) repeat protein